MKLITSIAGALFLAMLCLSFPTSIFVTEASASRMDGKATCGQSICMSDRYHAAKRNAAKVRKSK
jgi:hypothetical protein